MSHLRCPSFLIERHVDIVTSLHEDIFTNPIIQQFTEVPLVGYRPKCLNVSSSCSMPVFLLPRYEAFQKAVDRHTILTQLINRDVQPTKRDEKLSFLAVCKRGTY